VHLVVTAQSALQLVREELPLQQLEVVLHQLQLLPSMEELPLEDHLVVDK
jgi:hypothetical protein